MDRIAVRNITWYNVANAYDDFIGWLLNLMYEEPDNAPYWQEELTIAIEKKHEALRLAEQEQIHG